MQLTDLHLGRASRLYRQLLDFLGSVRPDLWLVTGDLLESASAMPLVRQVLTHLKARIGVYGVLGNNDHRATNSSRPAKELFTEFGMTVLTNEAVPIERDGSRIWLVGVDDPSWWLDDLEAAFANVPRGEVSLLLAHSPDCAWEAPRYGADLMLCGHTHGGQLCLPFLGALQAGTKRRRLGRRFASGVIDVDGMPLFVCRGLGTSWLPVRLFCPREIAEIELRSSL